MKPETTLRELARSEDADSRQRAASRLKELDPAEEMTLALEMLGDKDWRVRKTVVDSLVATPSEEGIRLLLSSLSDSENAGKRNSATEALIRIGDEVVPFVIFQLGREADLDVRLSLVNLLGDIRNDDGFTTLLDLMRKESDRNVCSSIVSSIGKYRNSAAVQPLIKMLPGSDLWLKFHLIESLGEIGDRAALPSIIPLYEDKTLRKPVLEAVGKIGDAGTVRFLLNVISTEAKLNLVALRALIRIADADLPRVLRGPHQAAILRSFRESFPASRIDALIEQLGVTSKPEVRNFILKFLGWSGDLRAVPSLLEHLSRPDSSEGATQALIDLGASAAPELLEALRASQDDDTTMLLLRVVRHVAGSSAVPAILTLIDHQSVAVRRVAVETLGELLDPRTLDYLLAKLDDPDVATQQVAVDAVPALVEANPGIKDATLRKIRSLLASPSVPVKVNSLSVFVAIQGEGYPDELLLASKNADPVIRQKAISLMSRFAEERFADQVVLSLADESPAVRLAAIQSLVSLRADHGLAPLLSALEDSDVWIRAAAAQALGGYSNRGVVEALSRHAKSDAIPVRIAALESLARTGREDVIPIITEAALESDPELRRASLLALALLPGPIPGERLRTALSDSDWRIRAAAAESLGARVELGALDELHRMLAEDRDDYVKQTVVRALGRIGSVTSFPHLLEALGHPAVLDDVTELLLKRRDLYGELLERAWRTSDRRHEAILAAILQTGAVAR